MPYNDTKSLNQTLTEILGGEKSKEIIQFLQSFIATFNDNIQAAKMISTGKLEMSSSKKEEAAQFNATGVLDVASLFQVPTGILSNVTKKAISAVFKGVRRKGYKKVAGLKAHGTHVELIAEALSLALIAHYKNELLDEDTLSDPQKWGKKTAKRLLTSLKSKNKNSLELKAHDNLAHQLKALFEWCVKKDYVRGEPEPHQNKLPIFSDDDYSTLLLLASAELLGLPRDHFVQAQQDKAKAEQLEHMIDQLMESSSTEDKPDAISVTGLETKGHLVAVAAGNNPPPVNVKDTKSGGHAFLSTTGEGADKVAARKDADTRAQLLSQPVPASQATHSPTTTSLPAKNPESGQRLGGKAKQSRLVTTLEDIKDKEEEHETQEEWVFQKKTLMQTPH